MNRARIATGVLLVAILALGLVPLVGSVSGTGSFGAARAAGPYSIWPNPVTPGFNYDDPTPIEMGLRFRSDISGYVTGVRFFKAVGATGTHIGRLWTTGGAKLAEVTFANETGSGWQSATFPSPVAIQPGTTYIVSYYVGDGNMRFSDTFDFFASAGVDNPPLHALATGVDGPNGIFSDDGGWFDKSYRASNYWVDVIFNDSAPPPDNTPPLVGSVTPAAGFSGVPVASSVTASFNEAMDPATIGTGTFELRDAQGALVAASVGYDASAFAATLVPSSSLAHGTTYTARVIGGASGVKDVAGNPLAVDYTWSFTTLAADVVPPTVASVVPANGATGVLVGSGVSVTFSEPMDAATIATGTIELRDAQANLVSATVGYAAGTNTATLTPGASLAFNTTYTARVKSGASGVKDVAGNPLATDYTWTFTTETPDVTPPTVSSVMPTNGVTRIRPETRATARFSEALDAATITAATFELRDASNHVVPATVTYDAGTSIATLAPAALLARAATYTARVKGGASGVTDAAGNPLAADHVWSFSTAPVRPPVDLAPGGPILVIATSANLYTRYFTEILRTEGLNEFDLADISQVTAGMLSAHDVVILGDMALDPTQVGMLTAWVTGGGHLVAMRPDKQLASLLGLTDAGSTLSNGYVLIDTSRKPGTGIVGQTLQFHGTADTYTLNGATALATLYSDRSTATSYPAVTLRAVGTNGGVACAFTFDLARSIVWTHQGNPAWQVNHVNPLQDYGTALDLFYPDWIDFNRITIPQADEQQRFLANLILYTNAARRPLPRFWYLPKGKKAAIILTGDDHWGISSPSGTSKIFFDRHKQLSPPGCAVDDWECVRSSSYGFDGALMTDQEAADYTAQGFEFGLHADAGLASGQGWCGAWPTNMPELYNAQLEPLMLKYASIPVQSSERSHCYSWFGYSGAPGWLSYAGTPEVEVNLDIHMDTNISYNPAGWATTNPGYQMGSGMMMRFAQVDPTGVMTKFMDIYNAGTQMNDDNGQGAAAMRTIVDAFLDNATGPQGFYGGFCVNMHSDNWYGWSYDGSDQIVASAQAHGIPVVSGRQMVDWLDGRNASTFGAVAWDGTTLGFTVQVGTGARNLMGMVPAVVGIIPLATISRDGQPVAFTVETIKGSSYAFFPATAGAYAAVYTPDTTPPVVTGVTATPTSGQAATIGWTTSELATSRVDYGTSAAALAQGATDPNLLTQHAVTLTGLLPNTTYYFRVVSADASGNTATEPAAGSAAATFTTPSAALGDRTLADFGAGSAGTGLYLGQVADGEVMLAPALATEFPGTALPSGWSVQAGSGTAAVSGGVLALNAATVGAAGTFGPGSSVEVAATFTPAMYEHVGFGVNLSGGGGDAWAIISTGASGTALSARTWTGSGAFDTQSTPIPGSFLGASHRYRVDWNATSIEYYVDGVKVATHNLVISAPMRPLLSVGSTGATALTVDWVHVSPYASSGVFTSRVLDSRTSSTWQGLSWTADVPDGTALSMSARTGDVPAPDGTWSAFTPIATSGSAVGGQSRYIQYQATLATSLPAVTPLLRDVSVLYTQGQAPPPLVTALSASPTGARTATITWTTDVPATSRIDYGTSASSLASSVSQPTLVEQHTIELTGLTAGTQYFFRITSADATANATVAPAAGTDPATFTTLPLSFSDVTAADFGAGSPGSSTYVSLVSDGEVMLAPVAAAEFSGSSLPFGWSVVAGTGTATVANGVVALNGSTVGTTGAYSAGHSVEAVATFAAGIHQHVGFGVNLTALPGDAWAIISTGAGGTSLSARTWTGNGGFDTQSTPITGSFLGVPHRYRVDWNANSIDYYVDGLKVATHDFAITAPMRPLVSVGPVDPTPLTVDWVHLSPYPSAGSFTSRVFDAGEPVAWQGLSWTADVPAGTTLSMSARTGSVPVPDATWTAFTTLPSPGSLISGTSQYVQYQASLSTTDPALTPTLRDAQILYAGIPQSTVAAVVPPSTWITTVTPCVSVPVVLTRSTGTSQARAVSVKLQLGPELRLCDPVTPKNSIHAGSWLAGYESSFQVIDRGNGLYQVDQAILGLPCGITTGGQLFTLDLTGSGADGTGALTVTAVTARDCDNGALTFAPGAAASVLVDRTPPGTVADLAVSPGAAGSSGRRKVAVAFTTPGDAAAVEVYRAPFGSYPLYERTPGTGAVPAAPTLASVAQAPWTRVTGLSGPGSDDPGTRDYWYYAVVTRDAHGNAAISPPSAGALDYVLGDVHNGLEGGECTGDDAVTLSDISYLGAHYGLAVPTDATYACLDVGPTTDYATTSRSRPDGMLDFEDLVLFALDFGTTVPAVPAAPARAHPATLATAARTAGPVTMTSSDALALRVPVLPGVGESFEAVLEYEGHGEARAVSVELSYDPAVVQPVGVADGDLLASQSSPHVTLSAHAGNVDVALLGGAGGLAGRGDLARVTFRVVGPGEAHVAVRTARARDASNRESTLGGTLSKPAAPAATGLSRAMPTPFAGTTAFELSLARAGSVRLAVYGVNGRRIRTLASGERDAGVYRVVWDGRDDDGRVVPPGMYFAHLTTRGAQFTRSLVRVR